MPFVRRWRPRRYNVQAARYTRQQPQHWRPSAPLESAGAFAIVLECVPANLGAYITEQLTSAFTIGIGAGAGTDGQVLVVQDMLAMTAGGFKPKMVRQFAQVGEAIKQAYHDYDAAVQDGSFPAAAESYKDIDPELMEEVKRA